MADPRIRKIKIAYCPRNWAKVFHSTTKRWRVLITHRRAGKTTAILNHLQRDAVQIKGSQYAYLAPTYRQAKRIAWEILKTISRPLPNVVVNESELTITYHNGSKIFLAGSENVDSLRGISLWGGAQDEAAQQPTNLFSEVISKCLADHLGYWIFAGTPKGKNHFYKIMQAAQQNPDDYELIVRTIDDSIASEHGTTIQNLKQALEDDRRLLSQGMITPEEFNQEWYCSFEAPIKGAYYALEIERLRREKRFTTVPHDPGHQVFTVCDLGVGSSFAQGFYQKIDNQVRLIDFWVGTNKDGMPEMALNLRNKPYIYGKHFAPHDVQSTDIGTGKSRLETARALGIEFEVVPRMKVDDGINAGRLLFNKLWVNDLLCEDWLDAISMYKQEFDEDTNMYKLKPCHDWTSHYADVHRYAALVEDQFTTEKRRTPRLKPVAYSEYEGNLSPRVEVDKDDVSVEDLAKM